MFNMTSTIELGFVDIGHEVRVLERGKTLPSL